MSYNVPVRLLQGGSALEIASGGTLAAASAGSVSLPSGVTFGGNVTIAGTTGAWAFGSAALASGTAMIYTGLSTVQHASVTPVTAGINAGTGAGTATSFQIDLSRAGNGSVFALGLTGTSAFTGAGTVTWAAFGRA